MQRAKVVRENPWSLSWNGRAGAPPQGGRGGRVPPNFESAGDNPPIFRKIVGQIRWVFGFWYGLSSEENPGFAAAWSPSPPFSSAWRSPCGRDKTLIIRHRAGSYSVRYERYGNGTLHTCRLYLQTKQICFQISKSRQLGHRCKWAFKVKFNSYCIRIQLRFIFDEWLPFWSTCCLQ